MSILKSIAFFLTAPFRWAYESVRDLAGFGTRQDFFVAWWSVFALCAAWWLGPLLQETLLPGSGPAVRLVFECFVVGGVVLGPLFLGYAALFLLAGFAAEDS